MWEKSFFEALQKREEINNLKLQTTTNENLEVDAIDQEAEEAVDISGTETTTTEVCPKEFDKISLGNDMDGKASESSA